MKFLLLFALGFGAAEVLKHILPWDRDYIAILMLLLITPVVIYWEHKKNSHGP